jgi:hypothetical protein
MVNWHHPQCFNLPRNLSTVSRIFVAADDTNIIRKTNFLLLLNCCLQGAGNITPGEFVNTLLVDSSGGLILPGKAEELAEGIGAKVVQAKAAAAKVVQAKAAAATSAISKLRDGYAKCQREVEEGTEPASKKRKSVDTAHLDAFGKIEDMKVAGLCDVLEWNKQSNTGPKAFQMMKVIDGEVYGRLAGCPLCSGAINLQPDCITVTCHGTFDESLRIKMECAYQAKPSEAPRWKPWYVQVGPTLGSTGQAD